MTLVLANLLRVALLIVLFVGALCTSPASAQGATGKQADEQAEKQVGVQLVVFPFASDEPRLGVAVADRLTHAFSDLSIPPELALGLVPPLVLQEGAFISPLNLLGDEQTGSRYAAALLRETLAVETAVTGRVRYTAGGLELELFVARPGVARSFLFRAPEAFPDRLVREAQAALVSFADLTPRPAARFSVDLSSPYGTFIDGLVNLGSGFPNEANPLLRRAAAALSAEPRWQARAAGLQALLSERPDAARTRYPLLAAVVALNTQPFNEAAVTKAFSGSELPLAQLWEALLTAQTGAAGDLFTVLPGYPFSAAERLLYRVSQSESQGKSQGDQGETAVRAELQALLARQPESVSVRVAGLFIAQTLRDGALEQRLAERLTDLAPAFAYPYERLSQLAFDRDDPDAAAVALRTATRLEPQSALYWTNLGWAYYLLDVLAESEAASERALELNANELVALYNLGLVQVVTGRLGVSLGTYAEAILRDLEDDDALDPAAVADLQDALSRYPSVPGVHYALATLLEAEGEFSAAAEQYERYAARGQGALVAQAEAQAQGLRAPPPPLEIAPGARVGVGPEALNFPGYAPGDLLYARFELATPGDALPAPLGVTLRLKNVAGRVVAEAARTERTPLPPNTVALETQASLELPPKLPPGPYQLVITVRARGRSGQATLPLRVTAGAPPLVRQLLGRGITLRSLGTGLPLYAPEDVAADDSTLVQTLQNELAASANAATETLPEVSHGRFAGQSGSALFGSSSPRDVRDFLEFLLQDGAGTDAPFAELYVRWALGGAPTP